MNNHIQKRDIPVCVSNLTTEKEDIVYMKDTRLIDPSNTIILINTALIPIEHNCITKSSITESITAYKNEKSRFALVFNDTAVATENSMHTTWF